MCANCKYYLTRKQCNFLTTLHFYTEWPGENTFACLIFNGNCQGRIKTEASSATLKEKQKCSTDLQPIPLVQEDPYKTNIKSQITNFCLDNLNSYKMYFDYRSDYNFIATNLSSVMFYKPLTDPQRIAIVTSC